MFYLSFDKFHNYDIRFFSINNTKVTIQIFFSVVYRYNTAEAGFNKII